MKLAQWQWGDEQPFEADTPAGTLQVVKILRFLPGKRLVADARLNGQPVIAKFFFTDKAAGAGAREAKTLSALADDGLLVPKVINCFPWEEGQLLILEKLEGQDLHSLLGDSFDRHLFEQLLETVRAMFLAGWQQTDMHPGNFILVDDSIFCLDGGAIAPVATSDSRKLIANLGLLCAQASLSLQPVMVEIIKDKLAAWGLGHSGFESLCRQQLGQRIRRAGKKWRRSCSAIKVVSVAEGLCYLDRSKQAIEESLLRLCQNPERLPVIKRGSRVTVYGNDQWVIKCYLDRSYKSNLRQRLGISRATISWCEGWTWDLLGIPTPRPVMLLESPNGRVAQSVIVFPRLPTQSLSLLMETQRGEARKAAQKVRKWLALFGWAGLRHGDMKAQNILVDSQLSPVFIDLDGAASTRSSMLSRYWNRRDRRRFEENWEQFQ